MWTFRAVLSLAFVVVCLFGDTANAFAEIDNLFSWKLAKGALTIESSGKPVSKVVRFTKDGEHYFILSLDHAILRGAQQVLETDEPQPTVVEVSQYTTNPDVVHFVVRQKKDSVFSLESQSLKDENYELKLVWRQSSVPSFSHFKVFLDVGHGGYDPGGTGPDGLPESFVNLSVAKKVAQILRASGVDVELDRTQDLFVSLAERVSLADQSHANIFLGLYCNASRNPALHGTTTYYFHSGAQAFAGYLGDQVAHSLGLADNGAVQDNLYVIKNTTERVPDVIIEYAYISNRGEERLLSDFTFRDRIANAVANYIIAYYNK